MKLIRFKDFYLLFALSLIKMVGRFSSPGLRDFVAKGLAFAAYQCSRNKRRLSEENVFKALGGDFNEKERREIIKVVFQELWRDTFLLLSPVKERSVLKGVTVEGLEHLRRALRNRKGVILWESNSFGRRVLSKRILAENGFWVHQVYGNDHIVGFLSSLESRVRNQVIRPTFAKWENQFLAEILYLPRSDSFAFTRTLLDRLEQNAIICIPGDGKSGQKTIQIKFLGRTEPFSTGMVSLARISGASILPMLCYDEGGGKTRLMIEPPIPMESKVDRDRGFESSITQYANLLESHIRKHPEQYQNWHLLRGYQQKREA